MSIERTITKTSRSPRISRLEIDGQPASEKDWLELLRTETGVDAAQLALLAFVYEGATISIDDAGLSMVEMLAEVFGVGRLRRTAEEYELTARRLDREGDNLRKSLRDNPSKSNAQETADLDERLTRLVDQLEGLRAQERTLKRQDAVLQEWARYDSSKLSFHHAVTVDRRCVSEFIDKIRVFLEPSHAGYDELTDRRGLAAIVNTLSEQYDKLILDRGRLEGGREAALRFRDLLSGDTPLCPTCRQPLSRDAANSAIVEHQEVIDSTSARLAVIEANLQQIRPLIAEGQALISTPEPAPPLPPSESLPSAPVATVANDMASLTSEISKLEQAIFETRAQLAAIQRIDEQRKQDAVLSARLVESYYAAERAHLAATTMTRLADAISAERIAPMAQELQKRWLTLSSDSKLSMDATGAISLEEGNYVIPYCSLSGGQRTLVQLAVRLLALQMATKCPFFILDEPLEHLDPRNRRSLATLLVHATHGASQLKQVLVTTYEESVTRRLSSVPSVRRACEEGDTVSAARVVRISATNRWSPADD